MSAPQLDPPASRAIDASSSAKTGAESNVIEYRAVSGLAVLALLLGAASAAAMVGPILWFIPIVGIVVALTAMRRICSSDDLAGWNIAFLGLLLALLFGIAAPARTMTRDWWLNSRAEQFSARFLGFLQQNKPYVAHQLRERPGVRKPLGAGLPDAYEKDPESKKSFEKFVTEEPAKTLLAHADKAKVKRVSTELIGRDDRSDHYAVRYEIIAEPGRRPLDVLLAVKRSLDLGTGRESWQIENITVDGVTPQHSHEDH